jgi:Protein of unknown function (DUF4013)
MRYQRSYAFVFAHPDWAVNLLAGSACMLLPVVGWALFIGYLVDVLDHLHEHPDEQYPAFDIDQIGHYLARGLLPALAHMVALLPVLALLAVVAGAMLLTGSAHAGPTTTGKVVAAAALLLIVLAALLSSLLIAPVALYLALGNSGGLGRFVGDFFKYVLVEAFLAQVFVVVIGLATASFGLLLCGTGAPPALALAGFAQYHLFGQLHALYKQRRAATEEPAPQPVSSNA